MRHSSRAMGLVTAVQRAPRSLSLIAAIAMTSFNGGAWAQTVPGWKFTCQAIGKNTSEPVGDRDGHKLSVDPYTCHTEGGFMDGANVTGVTTWEWDKSNATLLEGDGAFRKPGGLAVFQFTEGKESLVMTDGKVTGIGATATAVFKHASGSMAPYAGKTVMLKWHSIPGGQVIGDTTVE